MKFGVKEILILAAVFVVSALVANKVQDKLDEKAYEEDND